jgi:hypothetical protein
MESSGHSPSRRRSPSYPAIDLENAIDRMATIYANEGRNVAPNAAMAGHLGYSPKSGPGYGVLGALKRFGLLKAEGSGKSRVSELALKIILDEREDSSEREAAIRQAALEPGIHREIWEQYPDGLPSDATLRYFLRSEKGFMDTAADELIREFRSTVAFAKLDEDDALSGNARENGEQRPPPGKPPRTTRPPGTTRQSLTAVPIPLAAGEWVTLEGAFPLTDTAWRQMLRVLDVMKPGLVDEPVTEPDPDGG